MSKVLIIMGSKSDLTVMKKAEEFFDAQGIGYETHVASAHRNPDRVHGLADRVNGGEFQVVIAAAGMAAHLPGVMASIVSVPVIGVPIGSSALNGMDALLAIVQMPPGIPVATVAIDGAKNAGILAMQIMASANSDLAKKFQEFRKLQSES